MPKKKKISRFLGVGRFIVLKETENKFSNYFHNRFRNLNSIVFTY